MKHLNIGIVGNPLGHSISPVLHEYFLQKTGFTGQYERFESQPDKLEQLLYDIGRKGLTGFNVTIPFKQRIVNFLKSCGPEAAAIGAVNTVFVKPDGLHGFNTDATGFTNLLLSRNIDPRDRKAVVLGAGGAARAVVYSLLENGASEILVANRTKEHAVKLTRAMRQYFTNAKISICSLANDSIGKSMTTGVLVVNATSIGMWPRISEIPFEFDSMPKKAVVIDLVYNPLVTRFLEQSDAVGARVIDGLDMLIFQGIAAFAIWAGEPPLFEYAELRQVLRSKLDEYESN